MSFSVFSDVWNGITTYIVSLFSSLSSIFFTPGTGGATGSLTFVGILAVIGLGISLAFGIVGRIQALMKLKG